MNVTATDVSRTASELAAIDRELIIHPYLASSVEERVIMAEGSGCRLRDVEGREYLDATQPLVKIIEQLSQRRESNQVFIKQPAFSIRMEKRSAEPAR